MSEWSFHGKPVSNFAFKLFVPALARHMKIDVDALNSLPIRYWQSGDAPKKLGLTVGEFVAAMKNEKERFAVTDLGTGRRFAVVDVTHYSEPRTVLFRLADEAEPDEPPPVEVDHDEDLD